MIEWQYALCLLHHTCFLKKMLKPPETNVCILYIYICPRFQFFISVPRFTCGSRACACNTYCPEIDSHIHEPQTYPHVFPIAYKYIFCIVFSERVIERRRKLNYTWNLCIGIVWYVTSWKAFSLFYDFYSHLTPAKEAPTNVLIMFRMRKICLHLWKPTYCILPRRATTATLCYVKN